MSEDFKTAQARREAIIARIQAETGIDEAMVERLVRGFYQRVRVDEMLAPVFDAVVDDWEPHLRRMCDFWSSVALMSGRYHGQPMAKHLPLPIDSTHFDRWLELFEMAARELCPPVAADHFVKLSRQIGESLELGVAGARGALLARGERLSAV
jgi:hemoglobin